MAFDSINQGRTTGPDQKLAIADLHPALLDQGDHKNRSTAEHELRVQFYRGDALEAYGAWPSPTTIVSDGAYGVGGFPGDPRTPENLAAWYRPHIEGWSKHARPSTTLWFWNTEVGWANVHPVLVENGWDYVETITWDKGISHIAGNVNGATIRRYPVVSEVCVFYCRKLVLPTEEGPLPARDWIRYEWKRSGLPMRLANTACGVKDAATRKYFANDWLWYFPPPTMMERMSTYANEHGAATDRPYFSLDGVTPLSAEEWASLRYKWNHEHGLTNVWQLNPLHGKERFKGNGKRAAPRVHKPSAASASHLNQKPLEFMRRIIVASTVLGETIWEPFGGLCSASVAAVQLGRNACMAETDSEFFRLAKARLEAALAKVDRDGQAFFDF